MVVGLVGGSGIGGFNRSVVVFITAPLLISVVVLLVFPLQRFLTSLLECFVFLCTHP